MGIEKSQRTQLKKLSILYNSKVINISLRLGVFLHWACRSVREPFKRGE